MTEVGRVRISRGSNHLIVEPPAESSGVGSRLSAPREEVRNALLDATESLIQRYGYRKTSVEDIARKAGVSRATAYLYFSSKEELVLGCGVRRDRHQLEQLRTIAHETGPVPERIASLLLTRILMRFDSAQPYTESMDEVLAALREQVLAQRDRHHETEAALLAETLHEGIAQGELRLLDDPLVTARLLLLGTSALLPYSLSVRQLGARDEVEARARGLIDLLLGGLIAGGESRSSFRH